MLAGQAGCFIFRNDGIGEGFSLIIGSICFARGFRGSCDGKSNTTKGLRQIFFTDVQVGKIYDVGAKKYPGKKPGHVLVKDPPDGLA
jgi:hypothetical protein